VKTAYDKRRVKFVVGIDYLDSIEKGRETIHRVLRETEGVLQDPGPWVYVSELAPSSVNFTVYFWTNSEQANVLNVADKVATAIKLALDEAGIDMPYPHNVVLFHDATGSRQGDNAAEKYLAASDGRINERG
jgi:small-conductance mechanosensitive channel